MTSNLPTDPKRRRLRLLLWLALLTAGLLAAGRGVSFAPRAEDGMSAGSAAVTAPAAPARPPVAEDTAATDLLSLARLAARADPATRVPKVDLFAAATPARPAAAAVAPSPPRPQAPRFPYAYLGAMVDGDAHIGFFSRGERVLALRAGDLVDGSFRIEAVGRDALTVTYLPLDERLVVAFGAPP